MVPLTVPSPPFIITGKQKGMKLKNPGLPGIVRFIPPILKTIFFLSLIFSARFTFAQSLSTSPVLTPLSTHTVYLGFNYEGSVGLRSAPGPALIEPFIGLGLRWWERYIESANSVSGYQETYSTLYNRVGIRWQLASDERHAFHSTVSIDPMLWAREQIDWSRLSGETLTVKNGLRPGWTVEFGARGPTMDGTVYWRVTRFGESNKVPCLGGGARCFQPASKQDIIGLNVAFVF